MMTMPHWKIATLSALLMSVGVAHGKKKHGGINKAQFRGMDIESDYAETGDECTDTEYLNYYHFNVNLGLASYKDCSWVGEFPHERCFLSAEAEGRRDNEDELLPLMLADLCPLSCGLCVNSPLGPETGQERDAVLAQDDLTAEQIKELKIKFIRQKNRLNRGKSLREPCPCPDDEHNGNGPIPTDPPIVRPPTLAPTASSSTAFPTGAGTDTSTNTFGPTSATSSESSPFYTSAYTSDYTSAYTSDYTSTSTTSSTSEEIPGAAEDAVVSEQQSSADKRSTNRNLAIILSIVPLLLLLAVFFYLLRRKRRNKEGKFDSDTDESENGYPIHNVKSADTSGYRFLKVLKFFDGRVEDEQTDVHRCSSAVCNACDNHRGHPHRVMSVESYRDEYTKPKEEGRYEVKEIEC